MYEAVPRSRHDRCSPAGHAQVPSGAGEQDAAPTRHQRWRRVLTRRRDAELSDVERIKRRVAEEHGRSPAQHRLEGDHDR